MPADLQEEIRQNVYDAISRSLCSGCEEGNRQIRETRAHFSRTNACGVVFILNDRLPRRTRSPKANSTCSAWPR